MKAVRFYERRGLLPMARRSESGYRLFDEQDLRRLEFIRRAKLLGLSVRKIGELARHLHGERCSCGVLGPELRRVMSEELAEIDRKLHDLKLLRAEVAGFLGEMGGGRRPLPGAFCTCGAGASQGLVQIKRLAIRGRPQKEVRRG